MADTCTMSELLQAPTKGYRDAIVIPAILAENFELKVRLLSLVTSSKFHDFERVDPHSHIRWFNKITSTLKYKNVPHDTIKLMLFLFSLEGAAETWLEKESPRSIHTWEDLVSKFVNYFFPPSMTTNLKNDIKNFQQRFDETFSEACDRFKDLLRKCPHHGFLELHKIDTFYNALTQSDQDSVNAAAGGNILNHTPRDALKIIKNKSKISNMKTKLKNEFKTTTLNQKNELKNMMSNEIKNIMSSFIQMQSPSGSRSLPSNTVANPRDDLKAITTRIGIAYEGPLIPPTSSSLSKVVKRKHEVTKDKPNPKPSIPYPSRLNDQKLREKANNQMWRFLQIFQRLHFDISFADTLLHMPKFASTFKSLLINYDVDPRVPLILGRPFLRTARALIDVHGEELTLLVNDEAITFKVEHTSRYSRYYYKESVNRINVIDVSCEEYAQEVLGFSDSSKSGNPVILRY
nr:reverse transcriptase domain-containing protein [Tanacetum cinerariifolium]